MFLVQTKWTFPELSEPTAACESDAVPPSTIWTASVMTTVLALTETDAINSDDMTESTMSDARLTDLIF